MIETLQAYADICTPEAPEGVLEWVRDRYPHTATRWYRGRGDEAITRGVGWVVRVRVGKYRNAEGIGGGLQVWAEGNLTTMVYGHAAKALSLPAADVALGVRKLMTKATSVLPEEAPGILLAWRPTRVDASATWQLPATDVRLALAATERVMRASETASRRRFVRQSSGSLRLHVSQQEQLRAYDKRAGAYARVEPPRWLADGAGLLRIEEQVTKSRARKLYGETLEEVAEKGADVARERITRWLDRSGPALAGAGVETVVRTAVGAGMGADAAARLGMLAGLFAAFELPELVELGIPQRTAYRWAALLRDGLADLDPSGLGVLLDVHDAAVASREYSKLVDGPFMQEALTV